MIINIFGSTGQIGQTTLKLIKHNFPSIKVNLLCANTNLKLLLNQINTFKPKYIYLNDKKYNQKLKNIIKNKKIHVLTYSQLCNYLNISKSDLTILAVSGYKSLHYLEPIIKNTNNLGLVSKEAIVSAGHIFKKQNIFIKQILYHLIQNISHYLNISIQ